MDDISLKTGDIILSYVKTTKNPSTWISTAIRKISNQNWSHVSIVVSCWDTLFFIEALPGGVKMTPLKEHPEDLSIMVMRPNFNFNERDIAIKAMSKIGHTDYDMTSVLWFQFLKQVTKKWYGNTNASTKTDKSMYCSELVGWIYDIPNWWELTPGDFTNSDKFTKLYTIIQ